MSNTPTKSSVWVTAAAIIGGFAIFVLISIIAYLPNRAGVLTQGTKTPAERARILEELRGKELQATQSYAWVDQQKGVVRLPVDRAMEITIQELNAKQKK